ncbi:MAG: L-seryl-tRNA(Sec) selenium transferase [Planctomycetota bacterium]
MKPSTDNPYRLLPSVEEVSARESLRELRTRVPREQFVGFVQELLDAWREEIRSQQLDAATLERRLAEGGLETALELRIQREERAGIVEVVNVAGVVLNTGLGRAPVHPEAAARMAAVAGGYCVLEVDRETGKRNQRDGRLGELLARLTGAEAGIAVNNNAGACVLLLSTFAQGRATVVSRGELVEIGGSFRMPDVMQRADTRMVEVGTTNRTRIGDYRAAVTDATGLLLKVHTSNYRLVGFTEEVSMRELADLGHELNLPTAFDLGSGLVDPDGIAPLDVVGPEPRVTEAVAAGLDVVTFSGDKLLGGPQAGLLVGARSAIERLRANPLYRALRLDKVSLAGLERTLELYLEGRGDEIPARRMLLLSSAELETVARRLATALRGAGYEAEVVAEPSQPGSGSAPGVFLDSYAVRVAHPRLSAERLAAALRSGEPCVFTRIHEDRVLVDPRTLLDGQEPLLLDAFRALAR